MAVTAKSVGAQSVRAKSSGEVSGDGTVTAQNLAGANPALATFETSGQSIGPASAMPVQNLASLTTPASAPTGPPVPMEPPSTQIAGPILALRAGGDGTHQLLIALHPAELGPINVHVRIVEGAMTIQLASGNDVAHQTLRAAMPELHWELQSAGLAGTQVSLDLAGSGSFTDSRQTNRHSAPDPFPGSAPWGAEKANNPPRSASGRSHSHSSTGLDRWL
jgi:flagellar hook-length control protein FliK